MNRRRFLAGSIMGGVTSTLLRPFDALANDSNKEARPGTTSIDYQVSRLAPVRRFDGKECFGHPRAGIVPSAGANGGPRVVMTLNTVELTGSDIFTAMHQLSTDDVGKTWTEPQLVPELCYRTETIDGEERPVACSDFWPTWHRKSHTLLGTGHTVAYTPKWKVVDKRPRHTAYSIYDAKENKWRPWQKMSMGDDPRFAFCGAGSTQRYDLPDGTILLPIYFRPTVPGRRRVTIARCSFDGQTLKYLEHGNEIDVEDETRGIGEPSLTRFGDTYYMTIRHPKRSYGTRSRDGLHFEPLKAWTFDDGADLGNYETQQHWVTHSDGLFLVYTRRGLNNDYVFRNRAPLLMAQVDPERMCVLRATERELMPNRGARLGNFGVTDVSPNETWVTDAEWMQPKGVEKHGSDGTVWVSRIEWAQPNRLFAGG
jgi:hypothetical protein